MKDRQAILLATRLQRLNLFVEKLPPDNYITVTAAWLVLQACAGSKTAAYKWLFKDLWGDIKISLYVWWNFTIMRRNPEDPRFD